MPEGIVVRKEEHIALSLRDDVRSGVSAGFDDYSLEHCALPEIDFAKVDTSVTFLGRKLKIPLMISSMTGGCDYGAKINARLAEVASDYGIGLSVGSQRAAIEKPELAKTFDVRKYAPDILLFSNLGAAQLNYGYTIDHCKAAVRMIDADALILHLNPLHEVFQSKGNTDFSKLLPKIELVCNKLCVPVIVKEIGYGISWKVAKQLFDAGVYAVDIAGAGSISWVDIEKHRTKDIIVRSAADSFKSWGISTTDCLLSIKENIKKAKIIASSGVNNGVDMAKAMALGAKLCGNASTFLKKIVSARAECDNYVESLMFEFKAAMFATGCSKVSDLHSVNIKKVR